jgi:RNA polymerase sigma-70 factor (ECF subfamily)
MRRYHSILLAAAVRVSRSYGKSNVNEVDDIVQEIYLKLCADRAALLRRFQSPKPEAMFGYIKVIATSTAQDFFRRRLALKRGGTQTTALDREPILDQEGLVEQTIALAEVDRALGDATQSKNGRRDRAIFRLYYRHGLTATAIADLPGVELNPKGVEAVLHRLTKTLRSSLGTTQEISSE